MTRRRAVVLLLVGLASVALLLGCGKKGPPLPPLVGSKPRVKDLALRQVGGTVRASFSLPIRAGSETVDYRTKAVELWRRPVEKPPEGATAPRPGAPAPRPAAAPMPPRLGPPGLEQESPGLPVGEFTKSATLAQVIEGDDLFDLLASPVPELVDQVPQDLLGQELEYGLVLKTDIKSSGTVSDLVTITPEEPPAPPEAASATPVEDAVKLTWTPAKDSTGKPVGVNVYRAEAGTAFPNVPATDKPVGPPWEDKRVSEGGEYRYVLRSVAGDIESDATPELAATYRDVFAPAVPDGLRAFVDGDRVTLLWTPNDERDLLGYVVWRREVAGGEPERLSSSPLTSATYTDATARQGVKYEYFVTSVDRTLPPNESARSKPVSVEAGGR